MSNGSDIAAAFHVATDAMLKRELSPDCSPAPEPAPSTIKQPITPEQNDENREEDTKFSVIANDSPLKPTTLTSSTPSAFGIPNLLGLSGLGQGMSDALMTPTSPLFPSPVPAATTLRITPLTNNAFWQQMLYNNLMMSLTTNQRLAALSQSSAILTPSPSTPKSTSSAYSFSSVESLAQSDTVPSPSSIDRSPKRRSAGSITPATGREVRCPTCSKSFTRPWLLQNHMRVHTGEKPYQCEKCGKAFADKSNLRAHSQTHSGQKPFSCLRCGKSFALKAYLSKHEESACRIRRRVEF